MFRRCVFCYRDFPANESLKYLPLGKRLAFDPARGRLWAICDSCRRWTLAPIEERWEALEELDRLTTDRARLLGHTDNIALLRYEKLQIVRIGRANLAEQAWWRFGRELVNRRKAYKRASLLIIGGLVVLQLGLSAATVGGGVLAYGYGWSRGIQDWLRKRKFGRRAWKGIAACPSCGAPLTEIKFEQRKKLIVAPGATDTVSLLLPCRQCKLPMDTSASLRGASHDQLLRRILAFHHYEGAKEARILGATRQIDAAGSVERFLRDVAAQRQPLGKLDKERAIALEIAVNADVERQLLEMELEDLEARWREEEEIAAIVDGELTPVPSLEGLVGEERPPGADTI